jgi:DNA-binding IclR family transcriptional regulator
MLKSLKRALEILYILGESNKKYSIADISQLSGLPPSTVHRILSTLKSEKFVCQDEDSSLYYLGSALVSLGFKASNYIDLRKSALPIMRKLADRSGEDTYLTVVDDQKGVFMEHISGHYPLKIVDPFGLEVPLHCGAARKVLLAGKSENYIRDYLSKELKAFTENTVTNPVTLSHQLEKIKKDGFALTLGEYIRDAVGIAAPVKDKYGNVVASIGIIGPYTRLTEDKHPELISLVVEHAKELSSALGYFQ